jgi:hypothetical protein
MGVAVTDGDVRWSSLQPTLDRLNERLDYIEEHLEQMGNAVGYRYAKFRSDVPPEVTELARADKILEAIKLYRSLTGASFEQAQAVVRGERV